MLENTLCLYGSASSAFHLSRTIPEEDPMGRLLLTMLQQLGVETKEFAGCSEVLPEVFA